MLTLTDMEAEKEAEYQFKKDIEREIELKLEQSEETLVWFEQRRKQRFGFWKFGGFFPPMKAKRERESRGIENYFRSDKRMRR